MLNVISKFCCYVYEKGAYQTADDKTMASEKGVELLLGKRGRHMFQRDLYLGP